MLATFLQLLGLVLFVAGATVGFGVAGVLAACGVVAVFVGLAMERE